MKVNSLLNKIDTNNFIQQYLEANGIKDTEHFILPTPCLEQNWEDYPNIHKAINVLHKAIENNERIGLLIDPDVDGQCSAAIIYQLLAYCDIEPFLFFHKGKAHGLRLNYDEDLVQQIIDEEIKLMIIPDAGSNDINECGMLWNHNCQVIVLDHHEIEEKNRCAIIVNHHLSDELNHNLSGAGVVYKFAYGYLMTYAMAGYKLTTSPQKSEVELIKGWQSLVAVSLISDMCDLKSMENRYYVKNGLNLFSDKQANPALQIMADSMNRKGLTPEGFSWGTVPPINAICRSQNQESKELFFDALVGKGNIEDAKKTAAKAHREQNDKIKKMVEEIRPTLDLSHKVIIGYTNADNKEYIGLAANKFRGEYNKPCIILRPKDTTSYSGSLRSPIPIADKINATKLGYCQGHLAACGIIVKKSNLKKLIAWFDNNEELEVEPEIQVTASISPKAINLNICRDIENNKDMFGEGLPEPTFYINKNITEKDIQFFRKKTTTLKIIIDGVDFIKFGIKPEEEKELTKYSAFNISIIATLGTNTYENMTSPQAMISSFEVTPIENNDDSWEDLFY